MSAVDILALTFLLATLLPVAVLAVQVALALLPGKTLLPLGRRPRLAILIPAHNEALGIADTLRSIIPQLDGGDRLLVVADNCADDTAQLAATMGAEVVERRDANRRGKGYALDFGVRHLAADSPDMLLIVDADCQVQAGAIDSLARVCSATARPVQALYLMRSPAGAGLKTRIAEFAWVVRNLVRPLGWHRLGLPCQLMGTGMAFPWPAIARADLANGHIVEDMKLGIDLAREGTPPLFCPDALVTSVFPSGEEAIRTQRTRWEHGHLGMILSDAPSLLWDALRHADLRLLAVALDLCVPPLVLLCLLTGLLLGATTATFLTGASAYPLVLSLIAAALLSGAVLLSWWRFGRAVLSFGDLAYAALYALSKIPLYARFLTNRQVEWVRSKRHER